MYVSEAKIQTTFKANLGLFQFACIPNPIILSVFQANDNGVSIYGIPHKSMLPCHTRNLFFLKT